MTSEDLKAEAIEYRIKLSRMVNIAFFSLILYAIAYTLLAVGLMQKLPELVFGSVFIFLGFLMMFCYAVGLSKQGYCRRFSSKLFGEYSGPPLDDWRDWLEDRDAFGGSMGDSE